MPTPITISHDDGATAALLAAGKALGSPINVGGCEPIVLVPEGFKTEALKPAQPAPLWPFISAEPEFTDAESLIIYVNRFKTASTLIFAEEPVNVGDTQASFTAYLDYHGHGTDGAGNAAHVPDRCTHIANYGCPLSPQFLFWRSINGKSHTQDEFARVLDLHRDDITTPDGAALLELVINFESKINVAFASKIDRVSGGRVLQYTEEVDSRGGAGQMKIPDTLTLLIPIFRGDKPRAIHSRLETRVSNGRLHLSVILLDAYEELTIALKEIRAQIETETNLPILTGAV